VNLGTVVPGQGTTADISEQTPKVQFRLKRNIPCYRYNINKPSNKLMHRNVMLYF
jgi:hypothetical protein